MKTFRVTLIMFFFLLPFGVSVATGNSNAYKVKDHILAKHRLELIENGMMYKNSLDITLGKKNITELQEVLKRNTTLQKNIDAVKSLKTREKLILISNYIEMYIKRELYIAQK